MTRAGDVVRASFRLPRALYREAQRKARGNGETVTEVVVRKLAEYVNEDAPAIPP